MIMRIVYFSIVFLLFMNAANAQESPTERASRLLSKEQISTAQQIADSILKTEPNNPAALILLGRIDECLDSFGKAMTLFQQVLNGKDLATGDKCRALLAAGDCAFAVGNYAGAKDFFNQCAKQKHAKDFNEAAKRMLLLTGLDPFYDHWVTKETAHFIFHFQDSAKIGNPDRYMQRHEMRYELIQPLLHATLPKKQDFFVWADVPQAQQLFHTSIAFTHPRLCLTHTAPGHTIGHEMAHSMTYFVGTRTCTVTLINEGIAVYLDGAPKNNLKLLQKWPNKYFSPRDIWKGNSSPGDEILYPLGGELVKRLIETFGTDKFLLLLPDQSYVHAQRIYGPQLEALLDQLKTDVGQ